MATSPTDPAQPDARKSAVDRSLCRFLSGAFFISFIFIYLFLEGRENNVYDTICLCVFACLFVLCVYVCMFFVFLLLFFLLCLFVPSCCC